MLKLPIEYTDYNGVSVQETFYFNLSVAEVAEMELTMAGGLTENLKRIGESGNPALIIATFKDILLKSVGERSEDGRLFRKNPRIVEDFVSSGAYDVLFSRLVTDGEYGANFVKGIMPKNEDANSQHLIKAAQDRQSKEGSEERAIPQSVAQQAPSGPTESGTDYWGQYEWLHNQLEQQGINHSFIEQRFFVNLPIGQKSDLIKDLQGKLPQAGG